MIQLLVCAFSLGVSHLQKDVLNDDSSYRHYDSYSDSSSSSDSDDDSSSSSSSGSYASYTSSDDSSGYNVAEGYGLSGWVTPHYNSDESVYSELETPADHDLSFMMDLSESDDDGDDVSIDSVFDSGFVSRSVVVHDDLEHRDLESGNRPLNAEVILSLVENNVSRQYASVVLERSVAYRSDSVIHFRVNPRRRSSNAEVDEEAPDVPIDDGPSSLTFNRSVMGNQSIDGQRELPFEKFTISDLEESYDEW